MINRKIAMSGLSILAAFAMMGGSAFAAFTTTATAQGNTFSATTPNLTVQVNHTGPDASSVPGASVDGLVPGVPGTPQAFTLTNTDTNAGGTLAVTLKLTNLPANTLPGSDMSIVVNCGSGDITDTYSGWISTGHTLGNVAPQGGTLTCSMTPTLTGAGNADVGLKAIFDAVFTGSIGS